MVSEQQRGGIPTAQEIFGLPQGCRTVLRRTMADYVFQVVASKRPEVAAAVESIDGQTATLVSASDDTVELRLEQAVTLGSGGSYENVAIRVLRGADGLFLFSVAGSAQAEGTPPLMYEATGLSVAREGERFVLTSGEPRLRFGPRAGSVEIEAYTGPFLSQAPTMLRAFAPEIVGLFSVTKQG
ncbi:MAG TPA: hypothetical protein VNW97_16755 [Candidatus Saccharimonadales bacterium]|jgi:hypothetical protein|nr:hypothetical protein [Candidatus Saccharimonadales bacterium]